MAAKSVVDHGARSISLVPVATRPGWASTVASPLTSFVGRETEVASVSALILEGTRLVTLGGPGGVGKTRLALRIADELAPTFTGGVVLVDLSPLTDADLVLPTIAQSVGLSESYDRPLGERLGELVGTRRLLMVLDNMEHLGGAAPSLSALLGACPGLTLLVTSRLTLRLSAEHVFAVKPLTVPATDRPLSLSELAANPAVALFMHRARAADSSFDLTDAHGPLVRDVVRRLDGLPLAIELAAARMRFLTPVELLSRLDDRLHLLTDGPRDVPPRLRTMRDAIDWSHNLLTHSEQALFRSLAVFVGGFTLEAAEQVIGDGRPAGVDVDYGIASLLDKSLIQRIETAGGSRFMLLETIRQFAWERLQASGGQDDVERAHAAWCLALAEEFAPWRAGKHPLPPTDRLESEIDNLRSALSWAILHEQAETAQRIVVALHVYWVKSGRDREGLKWGERALALPGDVPPFVRALTLIAVSTMVVDVRDVSTARRFAEEGLEIGLAIGDPVVEVWACFALAEIVDDDDRNQVHAWLDRALIVAEALDAPRWKRRTLINLGRMHAAHGDYAQAITLLEECLRSARASNDYHQVRHAAGNLSPILWERGHLRRAASLAREELGIALPGDVIWLIDECAERCLNVGRLEAATRLLAAADAHRGRLDMHMSAFARAIQEQWVARSRAALSEPTFAAAWAAGSALSLEDAISEADSFYASLAEEPDTTRSSMTDIANRLTPRERDVLRLIAMGRSNAQIGDALFISPRTAQTHVTHLLAKLGFANRTEVAAFALRHGLA